MKRTGNMIGGVVTPENLRLAFWKASRGKEGQAEVETFRANLDDELHSLRAELLAGQVRVGDYHYFTIYDPKERVICAATFRERVLHHALMNVCHPVFERFQLACSYATRPGKGTYAALEEASVNNAKHQWYLKLDVRKFFDSIDHQVLQRLLRRKFKDRVVLSIFDQIIDSYKLSGGRGVPIGNLSSQYFANYYLAFLDHYVKEVLGHQRYVRYMDDMVLWGNDRGILKRSGRLIREFLEHKLLLNLKTFQLNSTSRGLPFLGYKLIGGQVRLSARSKRRFLKKIARYHKKVYVGEWSATNYQRHVLPLLAYVLKADSGGLRARALEDLAVRYPGH
jgi:RNA-directed DNA polymerase